MSPTPIYDDLIREFEQIIEGFEHPKASAADWATESSTADTNLVDED